MHDGVSGLWSRLSVLEQDIATLFLLGRPALLLGIFLQRGYATGPLTWGLIRRYSRVCVTFVALIAVSVALGTGLISQERALRSGTASAAAPFDLIVAAPGSEMTAMLAAVYLQPARVRLVDGTIYDRVARHESVTLAAPIAFGDSFEGRPVVGTTTAFVDHLSGGLAEGRAFRRIDEAIAGARAKIDIGAAFAPAHGHGDAAVDGAHGDFTYTVVGRMSETGSPWDTAILVPVESVWEIHGLANGHGPDWGGRLGPPFEPTAFPGTPAIIVTADSLAAIYSLRSEFSTDTTMAFLPGAVLARLHALLGDVREVMSIMAIVTQGLVAVAVLAGLMILSRLVSRQLALLAALGAPNRFVLAVIWGTSATLILTGALLGMGLGVWAADIIGRIVSTRTDIDVSATLGWSEVHLVAGFASTTILFALVPALFITRREIVDDLRS